MTMLSTQMLSKLCWFWFLKEDLSTTFSGMILINYILSSHVFSPTFASTQITHGHSYRANLLRTRYVCNLSSFFNLFPVYALKGKTTAPHSIPFMAYHYPVSEGRLVLVPVFKAINSVVMVWKLDLWGGKRFTLPKDIQIFSLVSLGHTLVPKMCIK